MLDEGRTVHGDASNSAASCFSRASEGARLVGEGRRNCDGEAKPIPHGAQAERWGWPVSGAGAFAATDPCRRQHFIARSGADGVSLWLAQWFRKEWKQEA
tara:strand:- start:12576 stop:12875 length:300 start_codon:yes stop_codon:yes gene_type:complete